MTVTPREVAGLPAGGPATLAAVKVQLSITDTADDDRLNAILDAVNPLVRELPVAARALQSDPAAWPGYVEHGANMLCARLFRRRNSPAGVEVFGQLGAAYVQRNDPDIAQLLKLGPYALPQLG